MLDVCLLVVILLVSRGLSSLTECHPRCQCIGWTSVSCVGVGSAEIDSLWQFLDQSQFEGINQLSIIHSNLSDTSALPSFQVLSYLQLSDNRIESIDAVTPFGLPSVKFLDLRNNLIEGLSHESFSRFPNVEELYLSGNQISEVEWDAFKLIRLKKLDASNNNLSAIGENMLRLTPSLVELNLNGNKIEKIHSSHLSFAQHLKVLQLSNNKIRSFQYDSFAFSYMLEEMDLSNNQISIIPTSDLMHLVGIRTLNLSGNPITKISALQINLPSLQVLDLSNLPLLRVVDAAAFTALPSLHTVHLQNNQNLGFVSPRAFENVSLIFSLDISNSGLQSVSHGLLNDIAQVKIGGGRLDCGCQSEALSTIASTTIVDFVTATCYTKASTKHLLSEVSSSLLKPSDMCRPEVIRPFGDIHYAKLGSTHFIHCASNREGETIKWTLPNGTDLVGGDPILPSTLEGLDYFSSSLYHPQRTKALRPRVYASSEWFRIDVVLPSDSGVYKCTVETGRQTSSRDIKVIVTKPSITLVVQEMGAHYAALSWNGSLPIDASDRVALHLTVTPFEGSGGRAVQLSLHNPWFSYNVMRLKPSQNYTFCLTYSLVETAPLFGTSILSEEPLVILETCVDGRTSPLLTFWDTVSSTTVLIIILVLLCLISLFFFHSLFNRFHVWHNAKNSSRMNESISGMSFFSRGSASGAERLSNAQGPSCRLSLISSSFHDNPTTSRSVTYNDLNL